MRKIWPCKTAAKLSIVASIALLLGGCADLVVVGVDDVPFTGGLLMMRATVKNDGLRQAPASSTKLEVSAAGAPFTQRAVMPTPPLARGQQVDVQLWPFHLSGLVAVGQCIEARVCADSADAVSEGWVWEGNNCKTKQFCR